MSNHNMTPTVSVIIPCFQQGEFLSETLDSVLCQTFPHWECIIVNDGSTDNTNQIANEYSQRDTRFHYIEQSNQGLSAARNNGIKSSKGEFILPLDADDLIAPTYIEKAMARFDSHPETKVVYCKAKMFGSIEQDWDLPPYQYDSFIWGNLIFCTAFFRREDFNRTNGYNINMIHGFEDWDLWLSMLTKDSIVYQIDEPLFFYRQRERSLSSSTHENMRDLYRTIYDNHKQIYEPYCNRIIEYRNASLLLEIESHNAILKVKDSKAYRLGYFLLHPILKLSRLLKKNNHE